MPRFHTTQDGLVQFTAEEEAAWDVRSIPTPTPASTKEQLMAQLAALSAQIQALE